MKNEVLIGPQYARLFQAHMLDKDVREDKLRHGLSIDPVRNIKGLGH